MNLKGVEFHMKKLIGLLVAMMLVLPVIANAASAPKDKKESGPELTIFIDTEPTITIDADEVPL